MRYNFIVVTIAITIKDKSIREDGGKFKVCTLLVEMAISAITTKSRVEILQKSSKLPCDPASLPLHIHPKKVKWLCQEDDCVHIFTVGLFTVR